MKIAIFADTFHPAIDGVVTCMDSLARELMRRKHHVRFFVPRSRNATTALKAAEGLDVHWFPLEANS